MDLNTKPQGVIKVLGAIQRKPNKINVVADLIMEDEAGKKWRVSVARFVSDLKPYVETQEKEFSEWASQLRSLLSWGASKDDSEHFALYMQGMSVADAAKRLNGE